MTAMTPGTRRLLTACLFASVIAAPIAALSPQAVSPSFAGVPVKLFSQEGDVIPAGDVTGTTLRTSNHQASFTYQIADGALPPGVSMDSTGLLTGTFVNSTAGTNDGSAGTHTVTIRATNGSATSQHSVTWNVSRFRNGDVFAGIGLGRYQVFDEDGNFKYMLQAETQAEWEASGVGGAGTTTGCGYNRTSR